MNNLTIIVPAYNREKTIKRALDSIVSQIGEIAELMIINDGSTDITGEIAKQYKEKYPEKISYYEKQNEGIAATRNFGITHAKADYIMFVDSDDYIETNLIKELEKYMSQNTDIIKFKSQCVNDNNELINKIDGPIFDSITGQEAFNKLAFSDILIDSPCLYIFKKELFLKNDLFFKEGTYHEDFGLIPLVLLVAKSVVSLDVYGYYYVQTDNSITRNNDYKKTIKRFEDCLLHYDNMLEFISRFNFSNQTKQNIKIFYTNAVLLKLKSVQKLDRKQYIKEIKKRKMTRNIKAKNIKQLIKRIILTININWYLEIIK